METPIYNLEGKKSGTINLPESIFNLPWNADLVHQVSTSMATDAREPVAHAKGRGEVRGGGKKPYAQKGTGRARHGSIRSPIWIGGGVAHGPNKLKNFSRKVNRKAKAKALYTILSQKNRDGEVLLVDSFASASGKTSAAVKAIEKLSGVKGFEKLSSDFKNSALVAVIERPKALARAFGNIGGVALEEARNLNPSALLKYRYLIIENPEAVVAMLAKKLPMKNQSAPKMEVKPEAKPKMRKPAVKKTAKK